MNISSEIFPTDGSNASSNSNVAKDPGIQHWILYSIVCAASVLLGLPTNSYVIWLIVTGTGNGLAAEFFSLNLSVFEMLYSLKSLFELLRYTFSVLSNAMLFFEGIATTGRPLFQCLICVERYLAVLHPVTFLKFKPLRYKVFCSVFVWVTSLSCNGMVTMVFTVKYVSIGLILTQLILFLSIQLFCLVAVLRALKQSGPGERRREREEENHMKRRAFNIIRIISVTMVIINVPFIISLLLALSSTEVTDVISSLSYACFGLAGLVLPFLFLHRVGKLPFVKWQMQ